MGLMRHAHTDRTKPPLYISLRRVRTFYDRFAGLALISVLVNAIVFAIMIRSGINFLLADFVGNISAVCLTYLTIP